MKHSRGSRTRRAISALTLTLTLSGVGLLGAEPAAAAKSSVLTLEASRSSVTLYRYSEDDESGTYGNLGIYAVAGKKAFEVRAKRTSYSKQISASLVKKGKDKLLPTPADFSGLTKFSTTTFTDKAGKVVNRSTSTFCPNGSQPVRREPTAPANSPYPQGCYANPYSLGAVWGIQAGYAVSMNGGGYYGDEDVSYPDLPVGSYTATTTINSAYRKALGLSAKRATASVKVTVEQEPPCHDEDGEGCLETRSQRQAQQRQAQRQGRAANQPTKLTGKQIKPSGPKPDLRSLPAWDIGVDSGRYLRFSATVWNAGPGRLVVDGFRSKTDPNLMHAYQYFFTASGKQKGYAPVGGMEWDDRDGHSHWHFQDFAIYQLVDSKKKFVVRSAKEAFCLANTDAVNYLVEGANWKPDNTDLRTSCGGRQSLGVREVLDTGSGDTYAQYLPGQSFDLKGLANGTYYIQIVANPAKVLYEKKTNNNTSYRKVVISGKDGKRTVKVEKVGIITEPTYDDSE